MSTYAPAPGSAPLPRMIRAQAFMETRLLLRNGEQLLIALAIPLLVLIGGLESGELVNLGSGRRVDLLTPGVLALAVLSSAFTSLAIATGFERRYGVLKRLGVSPLSRGGLLAGKTGAVLLVEALQIGILSVTALALGWQPSGGLLAVAATVLLVILGTAALGSLALAMAGTLRAEATLAAANLVYLLLLAAGGVIVPLDRYPDAVRPVIELLPSGALAEGLREALTGDGLSWLAVVVLACWATAGAVLTSRTFRWE
jgi:ABC-2 type transport system permease protein